MLRIALTVCLAWAGAAASAAAAEGTAADPRQTWQLLDYIAVDYAGAVRGGQVVDSAEYAEMQEFATTARAQLAALPATAAQAALKVQADRLVSAIEAKDDPAVIAELAHRLGDALLRHYPIAAIPASPPDIARGASLYAQHCASCHGTSGHGDGPAAAGLEPSPIAFTDAKRAARRSPFALYEVTSQGLPGTAMVAFSILPEQDRWDLAFYVGSLAYSPEARAQGEALWQSSAERHRQVPSLEALTRTSEADLAKSVGDAQANAIIAYLRSRPQAINESVAGATGPLALARQRLADSLRAYETGDAGQAKTLALSAYLDGVEPVEPALAARDRALLREIESAMSQLREQLGGGASTANAAKQAGTITALFDRAEVVLQDSRADATTAFLGSFTILLREGLEALLIVIGMIAFLRKAERRDVLPYVHIGWIGALLAGVATWVVATHLVGISGANREVTEGLSSLFAAAVLLSVGLWMHQKSLAGRWQQYLHAKVSTALRRRSAVFLFLLAFVAVYREVFETILFFIAMWNERNAGAIVSGLIAGSVVLAAVAFWMLRISKRLPIGRFFAISSILIAVLAVVLVGKGIAALQEAGWVARALIAAPRIEWLGVYPSWQSLLAQLGVAVAAAIGFFVNTRASRAGVRVTGS